MSKRRKILSLLAGVALAFGAYLIFFREKEPTYEGVTLSRWAWAAGRTHVDTKPGETEPREAIRHIGAKAVPFLFRWAMHRSPEWKQNLLSYCERHEPLKFLAYSEDEKIERSEAAVWAFEFLDEEGKRQALPRLQRALGDSDPFIRDRATNILLRMAPEALTNTPPR
jgi:hypothetical protein